VDEVGVETYAAFEETFVAELAGHIESLFWRAVENEV